MKTNTKERKMSAVGIVLISDDIQLFDKVRNLSQDKACVSLQLFPQNLFDDDALVQSIDATGDVVLVDLKLLNEKNKAQINQLLFTRRHLKIVGVSNNSGIWRAQELIPLGFHGVIDICQVNDHLISIIENIRKGSYYFSTESYSKKVS